jgi:hypothetical protein
MNLLDIVATFIKWLINSYILLTEYSEDIYPYATFHLAEQETMAANPQMQMQQVLGYKSHPVSSIKGKQVG